MSDLAVEAPRLHALLVGVDRYLQPRLPAAVSYPSLAGAVADVERVEELLLRRLGVPPERIHKLTASHGEGDEPPEAPADRPTYDHLVAAFRRLPEIARPGEQVLIHYSGHGGRAKTTLPEAKGEGGPELGASRYSPVSASMPLKTQPLSVPRNALMAPLPQHFYNNSMAGGGLGVWTAGAEGSRLRADARWRETAPQPGSAPEPGDGTDPLDLTDHYSSKPSP